MVKNKNIPPTFLNGFRALWKPFTFKTMRYFLLALAFHCFANNAFAQNNNAVSEMLQLIEAAEKQISKEQYYEQRAVLEKDTNK